MCWPDGYSACADLGSAAETGRSPERQGWREPLPLVPKALRGAGSHRQLPKVFFAHSKTVGAAIGRPFQIWAFWIRSLAKTGPASAASALGLTYVGQSWPR